MKRTRRSPDQIIRKVRGADADADLTNGVSVADICKKLEVAEDTCYRWRDQAGGIKADAMKRLRDLEEENARPKAPVADLSFDEVVLRESLRGNPWARPGGVGSSPR